MWEQETQPSDMVILLMESATQSLVLVTQSEQEEISRMINLFFIC